MLHIDFAYDTQRRSLASMSINCERFVPKLREKNPVLIVVDVQKAFLDEKYWGGNRNNKNAEKLCGDIIKQWRYLSLPIIHIRHSSSNSKSKLHESNKGFSFNEYALPIHDETIITKDVNSAFIGTNLKEALDSMKTIIVVIIGLTTDHCVSTTARMAGNYGYGTYLVSDAMATFDRIGINNEKYSAELIHLTALSSLNEEFATVLDYETLINLV